MAICATHSWCIVRHDLILCLQKEAEKQPVDTPNPEGSTAAATPKEAEAKKEESSPVPAAAAPAAAPGPPAADSGAPRPTPREIVKHVRHEVGVLQAQMGTLQQLMRAVEASLQTCLDRMEEAETAAKQ